MSKDNNQDIQNPDYIPFPYSKKGKNGKFNEDIGSKHNPLFNPDLEKALRDDLNYDRKGSGNIAKNLINDISKPNLRQAPTTEIIEESPVPYNSAPKASVPHNAQFSNPKTNSAINTPVPNTRLSGNSMPKEPAAKEPVDKLIEDAGHKDRFVPSHEAIVESVVNYQDDDDKFESPTLLAGKTSSSRGGRRAPLKKESSSEAANASAGNNPIHDEQTGKRFTVVLGAMCLGLGLMLLIIYLFPPLVPIMGLGDKNADSAKSPSPAVSASPATPAPKPAATPEPVKTEPVKVYVVGAVKKPGVVSLPPNSRVDDAIKAAGGMTEDADPLTVNLAKRIKDEDQIIVREKRQANDSSSYDSSQYNWSSGSNSSYYDEPAPQASQEQTAPVSQAPAESIPIPSEMTKINLNGATADDLAKINGIGPGLSAAIIDYRTNLPGGYFSSMEQLKDVPGIGDSKYEILCQHVDL